jgi:shikimate kinase
MILKLKRTPGIYLVGFMGCGKTTVGRLVAEEIGWRFADLDEDIEHEHRSSISHLFSTIGEEAFRQIEHQALMRRVHRIQSGHPTVLALGGGTFTRDDNIELANDNGVSIWIDASIELVRTRVASSNHRPLAKDAEKFESLYQARRHAYSRADYRIPAIENNSKAIAAQVLDLPIFHK